jgi:hypothetical protein
MHESGTDLHKMAQNENDQNHFALKQTEGLRTRGYTILQEAERCLTSLVENQNFQCAAPDPTWNSLHVLL